MSDSPRLSGYSFGSIRANGEEHRKDLIVTPDQVIPAWWRSRGHRLQLPDMEAIFDAAPEVLIVGQGYFGRMKIDTTVIAELRRRGVELIARKTGTAVETYEQLRERHRVVVALHLTC